jgi:hypothetical protein
MTKLERLEARRNRAERKAGKAWARMNRAETHYKKCMEAAAKAETRFASLKAAAIKARGAEEAAEDDKRELTCDGSNCGPCSGGVTHLDDKGFAYCTAHGVKRRESGRRCRKLRVWELRKLERRESLRCY